MGSFVAADGIEIVFDDHRPDGADAAGVEPPVVLHHGFAADARTNWESVGIVERLVGAGRRVIALDARGHGRSGKPHDPSAYDSPAMARDVSSLIDHLGPDQVDLVGYSMGGFVSLEVATRERRVRRLVLGGIGGGAVPRREGTAPPIDREQVAAAMELDDPSAIDDPGAAAFRALADATGADRAALAAVLRSSAHRPGDLSTVVVPALVLVGDGDPLARGADRLVEALPDARLQVVPGDHLTAVAAPELVDALVDFLGAA